MHEVGVLKLSQMKQRLRIENLEHELVCASPTFKGQSLPISCCLITSSLAFMIFCANHLCLPSPFSIHHFAYEQLNFTLHSVELCINQSYFARGFIACISLSSFSFIFLWQCKLTLWEECQSQPSDNPSKVDHGTFYFLVLSLSSSYLLVLLVFLIVW